MVPNSIFRISMIMLFAVHFCGCASSSGLMSPNDGPSGAAPSLAGQEIYFFERSMICPNITAVNEDLGKGQACAGEIPSGCCMPGRPFYCGHGIESFRPDMCGCPKGEYPRSGGCEEITELVEDQILMITNEERKSRSLGALSSHILLREIAKSHADDMSERGFFSHVDPEGNGPISRASIYGFAKVKKLKDGSYFQGVAENIGRMPIGRVHNRGIIDNSPKSIARATVDAWIESETHKRNLLEPEFTHLGVGVAFDGRYYISVQEFH